MITAFQPQTYTRSQDSEDSQEPLLTLPQVPKTGNDYIDSLVQERSKDFYRKIETKVNDLAPEHKEIYNIYKGIAVKPVMRANTSVIQAETTESAILTEAAYKAYTQGFPAAKEYLQSKNSTWTIDTSILNRTGIVVRRGDSTRVIFRGTDITKFNARDITVDTAMVIGKENIHPEYAEGQRLINVAKSKYSKIEKLVGFSKGGNLALNLGLDNNIPIEAFNPAVSLRVVARMNSTKSPPSTVIHNTTDDAVSVLSPLLKKAKVNTTLPNNISINPIVGHKISNFIDPGRNYRETNMSMIEQQIFMSRMADEFLESSTIADSIAEGLTLTEHFAKNHPGDYSRQTESIDYTRIRRSEPRLQMWEELGGTLTPDEREVIEKLEGRSEYTYSSTTEDRITFAEKSAQERHSAISGIKTKIETLSTLSEDIHMPNRTWTESLIQEIHPATAARGALTTLSSGVVGAGAVLAVEEINRQFGEVPETVVSAEEAGVLGTTSAIFTQGGKLTRLARFGGGVAGFAGAVGGQMLTEQALKLIGASEEVSEPVSVLSGGAIGGLTTTLVEGAAVRTAATLGVQSAITAIETGSFALSAETFGLSIVGGLVLSGIFYGVSKLIEHISYEQDYSKFKEQYVGTSLENSENLLRSMFTGETERINPEYQRLHDQAYDPNVSENTRTVLQKILYHNQENITPEEQLEYYRENEPEKYSEIMEEADRLLFEEQQKQQRMIEEAGFSTYEEYQAAYEQQERELKEQQELLQEQQRLDQLRIPREYTLAVAAQEMPILQASQDAQIAVA